VCVFDGKIVSDLQKQVKLVPGRDYHTDTDSFGVVLGGV
jgi:hypothetical protein